MTKETYEILLIQFISVQVLIIFCSTLCSYYAEGFVRITST